MEKMTHNELQKKADFFTLQKKIRVKKENAAFVYFILEAQEGLASYSTLPHLVGDPSRVLQLTIPYAFVEEIDAVLNDLGDLIDENPLP